MTNQLGVESKKSRIWIGVGAGVALVVAAGGAYFVLAGDGPPVDNGPAKVAVAGVPAVGNVLVDQAGRVLYLFEKDEEGVVNCTGGCASKWPPLVLAGGQDKPVLANGAKAGLVGEAEGEDGARVVTYNGRPLYRYDADEAGEASGQNKNQNGGRWFAVTIDGQRVK